MENRKAGYKRKNQKFKSLLIAYILLKYTDEDHKLSLTDIQEKLELYGVEADVHTISRDIKELKDLFDPDREIDLADDERPCYVIEYDRHGKAGEKGFKVASRPYEFDEIRLLAECVNSAKFISDSQSRRFKDIIKYMLCSTEQAKELDSNVFVFDRVKSKSNNIMATLSTINEAIRSNSKIKFQYMQYTLDNLNEQVPRRKGAFYIYSPFGLLSNNGNYYLLAYCHHSKKMMRFRVDRMKKVSVLYTEPREGMEVFAEMDLNTYTQRVFSMYGGEGERVEMHFSNRLLDTVIEQFGTKNAHFSKVNKDTFSVSANVEISDQFFSWICSFRDKASVVHPPEVVIRMKEYLSDIQSMYNDK